MLQSPPVVSVVIPVFRCEQILARALGSLLAQTLQGWEAVIVDDGSPEATWGVLQAYTWLDPRIRAVRREHRGVCAARNEGIAEARGRYLLFLDADDWLEPDALAAMVGACEKNEWVVAVGGLRYVTPDGAPTEWSGGIDVEGSLFESLCGSNGVSVPSSVLMRRSAIDDIGAFDTNLVHCGDWDMWARLARHQAPSGRLNQIVTCYRMSPGSLSRNPQTLLRDATTVIHRLHSPDPRVRRPDPRWGNGAEARRLNARIAHFAVYACGLAVAKGGVERALRMLDTVSHWPELEPARAAEFVFYALCFSRCRGPESFRDFWDEVAVGVGQFFGELESRTRTAGLARDLWKGLEHCADGALPFPVPVDDSERPTGFVQHDGWETYAGDVLVALARRGSA